MALATVPDSGKPCEYFYMPTVRFSNQTGHSLELQVEPWGASEEIATGSTVAITYLPPEDAEDTSSLDLHENMLRFWCAGTDYQLQIDGIIILT